MGFEKSHGGWFMPTCDFVFFTCVVLVSFLFRGAVALSSLVTAFQGASFILFFKNLFIYLFLAALGLCCCAQAFSCCSERGLLFVAARELLIAVASRRGAWALDVRASVVVTPGLSRCGTRALERRLSSCGARA